MEVAPTFRKNDIYPLAACDTAKLSSIKLNRRISPSETVRMSAKSDSTSFPVALILEASSPTITARSSLTKISWMSKRTRSIRRRVSRMKSEMARRPVRRPIQGSAPTSPAIEKSTSALRVLRSDRRLPFAPSRREAAAQCGGFVLGSSIWRVSVPLNKGSRS